MAANESNENSTAPAKKKTLLHALILGAFMALVVAIECVLAFALIPDADEVARRAEAKMTEKIQQSIELQGIVPEEPTVEFDLGQFSITSRQNESNTVLRIDFQLFGTVPEKEQSEMLKLYERHQHRLRDAVIFEIRNSDLNDLSDPGLALIKRRILEKSNRLLGKPLLQSVVFSEFSFVEQ